MSDIIKIGGVFVVEHWRKGKLLKKHTAPNGVTNEGLSHILDVQFRNQSQSSLWYFGLVDGASPPTFAAADTMASHAGCTENEDYSDGVRQLWTPVVESVGVVVNTAYPTFSIDATATIAGAFITNSDIVGGSSGTLWATALFSNGNAAVESGDTLKTYYKLTQAAA